MREAHKVSMSGGPSVPLDLIFTFGCPSMVAPVSGEGGVETEGLEEAGGRALGGAVVVLGGAVVWAVSGAVVWALSGAVVWAFEVGAVA